MGLSDWLGRLAANGPVPIFAVAGLGARDAVQDLRLRDQIHLLDTPRPANLLLVAGEIPEAFVPAIARIHDSMAHPRATLLWSAIEQAPAALRGLDAPAVDVDRDPVETLVATYRDLVGGRRPTESPILPDLDPAPWRGIGPYGQGGSGMTGGVPYGRPMAELGPDPDGLRLDVLSVAVGPLFPRFPAGLVLDVRWAGDLILEATASADGLDGIVTPTRPGLRPFLRALTEPVPIAELELERAREHLRWLSDALIAHGLPALGVRTLRLAATVEPGDGAAVRSLSRLVSRTQVMRWSSRGVGETSRAELAGLDLGPVARAAGLREDTRLEDVAYRELGFEPILGGRGDAAARWALRLAEAAQSVDLAARARDRRTTIVGRVESPRGRLEPGDAPADRLLPLIPALVHETEWGDTVTTVVSLDLDLEERALARRVRKAESAA